MYLLLQTIRLRGGPVAGQGRVEIFKDDEWGTVTYYSFNILAGNVACRQLGYGTIKTIHGRLGFGRGAGAIHLSRCRLVLLFDHHHHHHQLP